MGGNRPSWSVWVGGRREGRVCEEGAEASVAGVKDSSLAWGASEGVGRGVERWGRKGLEFCVLDHSFICCVSHFVRGVLEMISQF